MNTTSKPITLSEVVTASNSSAPVSSTKQVTVTERKTTNRFDTSARFPATLPNMDKIKNLWASKTVTSDRDGSTPKKLDAKFLRRQFNEKRRIASQELHNASRVVMLQEECIPFVLPSGGNIATGFKGFIGPLPWNAVITKVELNSRSGGSVKVDIWNHISLPDVSNSICGSNEPELTDSKHYSDTTLTGWTKNLFTGDILAIYVDSASAGIKDLAINVLVRITNNRMATEHEPVTAEKTETISKSVSVSKLITKTLTQTHPLTNSKTISASQPITITKHTTATQTLPTTAPITMTLPLTASKQLSASLPTSVSKAISGKQTVSESITGTLAVTCSENITNSKEVSVTTTNPFLTVSEAVTTSVPLTATGPRSCSTPITVSFFPVSNSLPVTASVAEGRDETRAVTVSKINTVTIESTFSKAVETTLSRSYTATYAQIEQRTATKLITLPVVICNTVPKASIAIDAWPITATKKKTSKVCLTDCSGCSLSYELDDSMFDYSGCTFLTSASGNLDFATGCLWYWDAYSLTPPYLSCNYTKDGWVVTYEYNFEEYEETSFCANSYGDASFDGCPPTGTYTACAGCGSGSISLSII